MEGPKWCYLGAFWVEPFIFWWWPASCFTDEHCRVTFSEVLLGVWESYNLWMFWRSRNITQSCNNLVIKTLLMLYPFFSVLARQLYCQEEVECCGSRISQNFPCSQGWNGKVSTSKQLKTSLQWKGLRNAATNTTMCSEQAKNRRSLSMCIYKICWSPRIDTFSLLLALLNQPKLRRFCKQRQKSQTLFSSMEKTSYQLDLDSLYERIVTFVDCFLRLNAVVTCVWSQDSPVQILQ